MSEPKISPEVQAIMEQLDACEKTIHLHKCFYCQIATAQTPIVLLQDVEGGVRVTVVGICDTCAETEKED